MLKKSSFRARNFDFHQKSNECNYHTQSCPRLHEMYPDRTNISQLFPCCKDHPDKLHILTLNCLDMFPRYSLLRGTLVLHELEHLSRLFKLRLIKMGRALGVCTVFKIY